MQALKHATSFAILLSALLFASTGCKPDYPACDTDKECKEKEFCVARKCQQCRDDKDCAPGKACSNGACLEVPGFCQSRAQCPQGQECIGNRCRPCYSDTECPSGTICNAGLCGKAECTKDEQCAQNQECRNGRCLGASSSSMKIPCPLEPVYFGFDQSTLAADATSALGRNVTCLKKSDRPVDLVGRADPRGTTEYNMALSDRRAQSVRDYLKRAGIDGNRLRPIPRGSMDASGSDESGWAQDRRVDSEWK